MGANIKSKIELDVSDLKKQLGEITKGFDGLKTEVNKISNSSKGIEKLGENLTLLQGSLGKAGTAVGKVRSSFDMFCKHPIIAVVTTIVSLVQKLADKFQNSEGRVLKLNSALAPFKGILDLVNRAISYVLDNVADLIVKLSEFATRAIDPVVNGMKNFLKYAASVAEKLGLDGIAGALNNAASAAENFNNKLKDSMGAESNLARMEEDLIKATREGTVKRAEYETQLAEIQNKRAQTSKENDKEYRKRLNEELAVKQKIAQIDIDLATKEYNIIKLRNSTGDSTTEDLQKEADALAKVIKAKGEYNEITKETQTVITELNKAAEKELEGIVKSNKAVKEQYDIFGERNDQIKNTTNLTNVQLAGLEQIKEAQEEQDKQTTNAIKQEEAKNAGIEKGKQGLQQLASAMGTETAAGKAVNAMNMSVAMSEAAKGMATSIASAAGVPFPGNIAAIAGSAAQMAAMIIQIKSLFSGSYANGGIISGAYDTGDRLIAHVNSGEMILNQSQQKRLFELANGKSVNSMNGGNVTFEIKGDKLIGVLNSYNNKLARY